MSFSKWIFKAAGWHYKGGIPEGIKKCVLVAAPHTSNWDYVWARLVFNFLGANVRMLIKKEAFFWPLGGLLRMLGGIPVDRSKKGQSVQQIAKLFEEHDELIILFTPEGTRKHSPEWKRGFYYASELANVPIVLGYLDYATKTGCISHEFKKTGNIDADIESIKDFYKDFQGKYPHQGVL